MAKKIAIIEFESDGDFYHYMLDKDHTFWAEYCNHKMNLGLDEDQVHQLSTWFANAMCAVANGPHKDYIKARIESEARDGGPPPDLKVVDPHN